MCTLSLQNSDMLKEQNDENGFAKELDELLLAFNESLSTQLSEPPAAAAALVA